MSTGPQQFKLLYRGSTVWLPPGDLFVGRSCSCHVVLEDPLVSRRHAQLTVTTRHATIQDLNSINGVFVNGERLAEEPLVLRPGDRVQIGNEEFEFGVGPRDSGHDFPAHETVSGMDPVVPAEESISGRPTRVGDDSTPNSTEVTCRADALVLLGEAADRALAEGYVGRAEQLLSNYLTEVLNDTAAGKRVPQESLEGALNYGLKLAWATQNGAWFDYAVALLHAQRAGPPLTYVESLHATLQRVGPIDLGRLNRYVGALSAATTDSDPKRQEQLRHANLLLQTAASKQSG